MIFGGCEPGHTFRTEGDADGFGENVDTTQHGLTTIMGELDLLVGAASDDLACRLLGISCASQGRRSRALSDVVHAHTFSGELVGGQNTVFGCKEHSERT